MSDGKYVGIAKIRYLLTPFTLTTGGHIGYGLVEAHRGRGYGTVALGLLIGECRKNGLLDVLITANPNNFPSRRVVEKNGGRFWDIIERSDGTKAVRYWIDARKNGS